MASTLATCGSSRLRGTRRHSPPPKTLTRHLRRTRPSRRLPRSWPSSRAGPDRADTVRNRATREPTCEAMLLPTTLIVVGFLVTLFSRIAFQRAGTGLPCPLCGGAVLRWTETRLVTAADGRPHDVIEAGQCLRCAAKVCQSHQNGWWRVSAFDGSAAALTFSSPLPRRSGRRLWRRLDRATKPVAPICAFAGARWVTGSGVVLGLACMVVGVCLPLEE